jgi:hypothetical protein
VKKWGIDKIPHFLFHGGISAVDGKPWVVAMTAYPALRAHRTEYLASDVKPWSDQMEWCDLVNALRFADRRLHQAVHADMITLLFFESGFDCKGKLAR